MSARVGGCVLVTSNPGKARELRDLIGAELEAATLPLVEPQSLDVAEVAGHKAAQAYEQLGAPVLVDDTGLTVSSWNGLPGALVTWFLQTVGTAGLLGMAAGLDDRTATATSALGYADSRGVHVVTAAVSGTLSLDVRGSGGFGFDPVFVPDGYEQTFAEMSPATKSVVSPRRRAAAELRRYLTR